MRILIFIFAIVLLSSCSPQRLLNSLLKHHPELVQTKYDTVLVHDTVPSVEFDTVFANIYSRDTITITQDRLSIKYVNDGKKVYIKGKCDTIVKEIRVPVETQVVCPPQEPLVIPWYYKALAALGLVALVFTGIKYAK